MSQQDYPHLRLLNPHPRDSHVRFEDIGHKYFLDNVECRKEDGFVSVTSLVHSLFPEFNKEEVVSQIMRSKKYREGNSPYSNMTRQQILDKWDNKSSLNLGSRTHLAVEKYYNQVEVTQDFLVDEEGDVSKEYELFLEFAKDHEAMGWKPWRTEYIVYDRDLKISGSLDCLVIKEDGSLVILDWKRTAKPLEMSSAYRQKSQVPYLKHLDHCNFIHYSLQLNVYKYLIELNYGKKISEMYLVRLHHSLDKYEKIPVRDLQKEVETIFKVRRAKLAGEGVSDDEEDEPRFVRRVSVEPPKKGPDFSECML